MSSFPAASVASLCAALAELQTLPASAARTMPPDFYVSPEFSAFENERIFRAEWVCLGHVGEVPKPGDYFTTDLVEEPLLVVRDGNAVRVLSNVCRHRGNIVATGSGNARSFACGYHAWTYDRDGALLAAPFMEGVPGFHKAACRLPEFRSEVWENFVFVNLDGRAPPLAERLAPLAAALRGYRQIERNFLFGTEDAWQTNWKSLTENFMEGYHLSATHLRTLHPITPTALCEKVPGSVHFTAYKSHYRPGLPRRGSYTPGLDAAAHGYSLLFCVFPSFVVSYAPHMTLWMCLRPLAPDRVGIRWGVAGTPDDPAAQEVRDYVAFCEAFNAEDRAKLEQLRLGLRSRSLTSGPLAPAAFEGTIWDFYMFMADRLVGQAPSA